MGLRHALAFTLIGFAAASPSAQRLDTAAAVQRARSYLRAWEQSLAAVVAEEHYTQTLHEFKPRNSTSRTLVSDVLLVHATGADGWLLFRDVMVVDDKPVQDRQRRFDELFVRPDSNLVATARQIADEGARFNLGRIFRNLNTPVAPLIFLADKYKPSVRWRSSRPVDIDGVPVLELTFEQKRAPFAVRSPDGTPQPAGGRLWIDPASGRVVQTELELVENWFDLSKSSQVKVGRTRVRIVSRFGAVAGLDVWVPLRMTEEYVTSSAYEERMRGEASYTNHRLFQTSARIVGEQ